jgi:hypothetical protein
MGSAAVTATRTAERAARSTAARQMGRWGLAARGAVYLVVAVLAARIAFGDGATADREGALHAVVRQPFGRWVLAALTVGFGTYAAYRLLRAATGRAEDATGEREGVAGRLGNAAVGIVYVALFVSSATVVLGGGARGGDAQEKGWTARLLAHAWGEWLVGVAGVGVVVAGIVLVAMGLREDFADKLRVDELAPWQRRWFPRLGVVGWVARGVVFGIIGVFLVHAAWTHDPREAVGVDGALHRVASAPLGPVLLSVVAAGLAAYGLYSLVEARWRRVLER